MVPMEVDAPLQRKAVLETHPLLYDSNHFLNLVISIVAGFALDKLNFNKPTLMP